MKKPIYAYFCRRIILYGLLLLYKCELQPQHYSKHTDIQSLSKKLTVNTSKKDDVDKTRKKSIVTGFKAKTCQFGRGA